MFKSKILLQAIFLLGISLVNFSSEHIVCKIKRNCTEVHCPLLNCTNSSLLLPPRCGECCLRCNTSVPGVSSINSTIGVTDCPIKVNCLLPCRPLQCPLNATIVPPKCGQCCPTCKPSTEDTGSNNSTSSYNSTSAPTKPYIADDSKNGTSCLAVVCPELDCALNATLIRPGPGECCPKCITNTTLPTILDNTTASEP
ncbi:kielin/chordin-like protein [Sitophilus oryzae]|uniref:Kielin/chordin-like protein n=1 Tax=Sitophilus oryzae TaxID=7048 RepID=A0A6J2X3I5_SITOR|nr:kielin/chordin-like protein [Sitophilus oryzae]